MNFISYFQIGGCVAMTLALLSKPRPGLFPTLGLKNTKWSKKSSNFGLSSITDLHKFHTNLKSGSNMALSAAGIFLSLIGSLSFIHICFYEDKIDQTRVRLFLAENKLLTMLSFNFKDGFFHLFIKSAFFLACWYLRIGKVENILKGSPQ